MEEFKITITHVKKPKQKDLNQDLQWFSKSIGLIGIRDKEKSCFRIFVELLKSEKGLTSDEIADFSNLARATAVHHIKNLIESGIVEKRNNRYYLVDKNLEGIVKRIERDIECTLIELKEVAKYLDKEIK
jgi:predicted transcriptional regulator